MTKVSLQKISQVLQRRTYKFFLRLFGLHFYLSYWHLLFKGSQENPDLSLFYLAARPNPGAGIGHQMANWIAGYWYAKDWKLKFAHIPFSSSQWEKFLGFGVEEKTIPELKKEGWKVRRIPIFHEKKSEEMALVKNIISSYSGQKIIFLCEQDQFYRDQYGVMAEIQEKFANAPARKEDSLQYSNDNLNIAIHVRRGDIMADPTNPNLAMRYLSNDYFEEVLNDVIEHYKSLQDKPIHVFFFSQGIPENYPEFANIPNLHWCLDWGARDCFLHMVYADVLITSKSSFSYKPALLNKKGIKVCPAIFWHGYPDSREWIMVDNNGIIEWR